MKNKYNIKEIDEYIIGDYYVSDYFSFIIYQNHSPYEGDEIIINEDLFEVESVSDDTTDEEREDGFSYSKVYLKKI